MKTGCCLEQVSHFDLAPHVKPKCKPDHKCKGWQRHIEVKALSYVRTPPTACLCVQPVFFLSLSHLYLSHSVPFSPHEIIISELTLSFGHRPPNQWIEDWRSIHLLLSLLLPPYLLQIRVLSLYNTYSRFNRHLWQISYLFLTVIPRPFVTSRPWCSPAILRLVERWAVESLLVLISVFYC